MDLLDRMKAEADKLNEQYAEICKEKEEIKKLLENYWAEVPCIYDNGRDYYVLANAVDLIHDVPGMTIEIGLREGGGSKIIIDGLLKHHNRRVHVAIDPYGLLPYNLTDNKTVLSEDSDYSNTMMYRTLEALCAYVKTKPIDFLFYPLEDVEFFRIFKDGVPFYNKGKKQLLNKYALVYFDGPHTTEQTLVETEWFSERVSPGTIFVYDDVKFYKHDVITEFLFQRCWKIITISETKIAYRNEA
jgi:hypothetical protein